MVPDERGRDLRRVILRAIEDVYEENARRYAPDELGDNNVTFGVSVTHNARHCVERDMAEVVGVVAERPRNSFRLRIDGRVSVYFYKAPPGAIDIRGLAFDESELKLEIRTVNADQLSFNFDTEQTVMSTTHMPTNIVIVHFGDPVAGFDHAEVGAPYTTDTGACAWAWHERFEDESSSEDGLSGDRRNSPDAPSGSQPGLGLRLREVPADDDVAES